MRGVLGCAVGLAVLTATAYGAVDAVAIAKALAAGRYKGYVYGSSGEKKIDCVQFLVAVVEEMAKKRQVRLTRTTRRAILISHLSADELRDLQKLVERGDPKIRGVQTALVEAKLGKAIAPRNAKAGDLVQYWYKTGSRWAGHAGIVEKVESGRATIYGSHKTTLQRDRGKPRRERKGGIGSGPVFDLSETKRKVYVVRWTK